MCDCLEQEIIRIGVELTEKHNGLLQVGPGEFNHVRIEKETHQLILELPYRFLAVNLEKQELQHFDGFEKARFCPFCGEKYLYAGLETGQETQHQQKEYT